MVLHTKRPRNPVLQVWHETHGRTQGGQAEEGVDEGMDIVVNLTVVLVVIYLWIF